MKKSIRLGLAAAAINYRLVPGATVEDEAADVAASLKHLIDHAAALGIDPSRIVLSLTFQAAAPNAPSFLLIHVQRKDAVAQNVALEAALKQSGTKVARQGFPGDGLKGHMEINRSLGDPSYAATGVVDAWLKAVFGK